MEIESGYLIGMRPPNIMDRLGLCACRSLEVYGREGEGHGQDRHRCAGEVSLVPVAFARSLDFARKLNRTIDYFE